MLVFGVTYIRDLMAPRFAANADTIYPPPQLLNDDPVTTNFSEP